MPAKTLAISASNTDEFFEKIDPYYDFINCRPVICITKEFIEGDIILNCDKYSTRAKQFRNTMPIKQLTSDLNKVYPNAHLSTCPCIIYIKLETAWEVMAIDTLYLLVKYLLPESAYSEHSLMKNIRIQKSCIVLQYGIMDDSQIGAILRHFQQNLIFMRLIGIFQLAVTDIRVIVEAENLTFTFIDSLHEATKYNNNKAVQFLLDMGIDVNSRVNGITALMVACILGHSTILDTLTSASADINCQHAASGGTTALMVACSKGHHDIVSTLVAVGADMNSQSTDGTALIIACTVGQLGIVQILLSANAEVDCRRTTDGATPLIVASAKSHEDIVQALLSADAKVNCQQNQGITALTVACLVGHRNIVCRLLSANADPNLPHHDGVTALILACDGGHQEIVRELLSANAKVNLQHCNGGTALMAACSLGYQDILRMLLSANADVNSQRNDKTTALMIACTKGHLNIVQALLSAADVDVDLKGCLETTALIVACLFGRNSLVQALISANANVNTTCVEGITALMVATSEGYEDIVQTLLSADANVNSQREDGVTTLMVAVEKGDSAVVQALLSADADVNLQSSDGVTAFMIACAVGHRDMVETLKSAGANVNLQRNDKLTPLMQACLEGHQDIVQIILLSANADINCQLENGATALTIACVKRSYNIVEQLLSHKADPLLTVAAGGIAMTSFEVCAATGVSDALELMLEKCTLPLITYSRGLYFALLNGNVNIITLILSVLQSMTSDIDPQVAQLAISCVEGDFGAVVSHVMDQGTDPDAAIVHGLTLLMIACYHGHVDVMDILTQTGADVNKIEDVFDYTALDLVMQCDHTNAQVVSFLKNKGALSGKDIKSNSPVSPSTTQDITYNDEKSCHKKLISNYLWQEIVSNQISKLRPMALTSTSYGMYVQQPVMGMVY